MKKNVLILIIIFCLNTLVYAEDIYGNQPYVKLLGGVDFLQTQSDNEIRPSFNPGYIISGAIGYQWCSGLHVEAEYAFRRNSMRKIHYFGQDFNIRGTFQSSSYMANLLWDFSLWECSFGAVQPYLGAGIGYDVQQFHAGQDGFRTTQNKKGFAWQLMAGFTSPFFNCSEISLEYRLHKGPLHNILSHVAAISFTYKFEWE